MDIKKIKEIKEYAKGDIKYYIKQLRNNESDLKAGHPETLKEFQARYPKGITSYYEEILSKNESPETKARLINRFGYTPEMLEDRAKIYHEAFWSSWKWWEQKILEDQATMAKYAKIFKQAEELAKVVDVSDLKDGFPCGMAVLYLKPEAKDTDLGKALRRQYDGDSYSAKICHWSAYKLPIKIPNYGQCMSFDERVCGKVAEFLTLKDIPTGVYSIID